MQKKQFFVKPNENNYHDMCHCNQSNDVSKISCTTIGTIPTNYNLPNKLEHSCDKYSIKDLKQIMNNQKIDIDILNDKIDQSKYVIHAGFTIKKQNQNNTYLFKNTKLHGNPVILYTIYTNKSNSFFKQNYNLPGIICNATFPGLKFKNDKIDRIDAACVANHVTNYVYFFKYEDGVGYVIKYDLRYMKISCDYKYPRKVEDEFKITDKNFLINPIINAIYINTNNNKSKIILFTAITYIEIYITNINNTSNMNNVSYLTFSSVLTNNNLLNITFSDVDSIISCGNNNKLLIFYNNYRFTYLDYETKQTINNNQYKPMSTNFKDIWKIDPTKYNKLINDSLTLNKTKLNFKCPEFSEDKKNRLKITSLIRQNKNNDILNKIKKDNESIINLQNQQYKQEKTLLTTTNILNESISNTQKLINSKQILINSTTNKNEQELLKLEVNNLKNELNTMVNDQEQLKKEKININNTNTLLNNACNKNSTLLDNNSYI